MSMIWNVVRREEKEYVSNENKRREEGRKSEENMSVE